MSLDYWTRPPTDRELEVLSLYARGMVRKEIGVALGISIYTVRMHLYNLAKRLGVTSSIECMYALGWVCIPDQYAAHAPIRDGTSLGHD